MVDFKNHKIIKDSEAAVCRGLFCCLNLEDKRSLLYQALSLKLKDTFMIESAFCKPLKYGNSYFLISYLLFYLILLWLLG